MKKNVLQSQVRRALAAAGSSVRRWLGLAGCMAAMAGMPLSAQVVITEFMADNSGVVKDEDGDASDWIEIFNGSTAEVNLAGWSLTDDPAAINKWVFPSTNLAPNSFMVVYASGKNRVVAGAPLHANFSLSKSGEFLGLFNPDGFVATQFAPTYPEQIIDKSYGTYQTVTTTMLISNTSPVRYHFPSNGLDVVIGRDWTLPAFVDSGWAAGTNGLGFQLSVPGFAVKGYKANVQLSTLAIADNVTTNASLQTAVYTETAPVFNYMNRGGVGNFSNDRLVPGMPTFTEDYIVEGIGFITIPTAGQWTFIVNSDDGFSLTVGTNYFPGDYLRGATDSLVVFNFPTAGEYPVRVMYFNRGGDSEGEFSAAQGSKTAYDTTFRLVGDTDNGGLAVRSIATSSASYRSIIKTDVTSTMLSNSPGAYIRIPFNVQDKTALQTLSLLMKYDDGFVVWLNGVEVSRRNCAASPTWALDMTATTSRSSKLGALDETIDLTPWLNLLNNGANLLAIHGLNDSITGDDFLISAQLLEYKVTTFTNIYFSTPTAGTFNSTNTFAGMLPEVKFSPDRGFYYTNFLVTITNEVPGAKIYYTLDGSKPSLTNGILYTNPVPVTNTTCLRAAAFMDDFNPSDVKTHTYIFVKDVIQQKVDVAPGAGWPAAGNSTGQMYRYGMDPAVVTNALYAAEITNSLRAIPTFSLVMNTYDLFDGTTGIYENASGDGMAWERPGSLELIYPDGTKGFQINAGIRMRGGYSRAEGNPKHAFRVFFRDQYGKSSLDYPMFGTTNGAATSFDKFDIRTFQNYSWSYGYDNNFTGLRDQFSRYIQLCMGEPATRGNLYHLYINGQYWGIYDTEERAEDSYGATYFGGNPSDYDVIKVTSSGYVIYATSGSMDAWTRLYQMATNGFASNEAYQKVQGRNPDGTVNPAYENLLDIDNLIDYMLLIIYQGNFDAPVSRFLSDVSPNNFYAMRSTNNTMGFRFFAHDSEHVFLNVNEDRNGPYPCGDPVTGGGLYKSNPQYFWQQLQANAEFRLRVADRIQKHYFDGGVLTPEWLVPQFRSWTNIMFSPAVAESARWGGGPSRSTSKTRNAEWLGTISYQLNTYFPQRSGVVFNQLKSRGLYPSVAAPRLSMLGGRVNPGYSLSISNTNAAGVIYYTLDGSDPRSLGGSVNSAAMAYSTNLTLNSNTRIRTRILNGSEWSASVDAQFYVEQDMSKLVVS